jgi:KaiC/GvpD/RAD55 family RecA-like ATPase
MSQNRRQRYRFEGMPIEPVPPGTNLLVAGPPFAGTKAVALRMLAAGELADEGLVLVATDDTGASILEEYTEIGGTFDRARMAVIDCDATATDSEDENIRPVRSPGDLTGIGIEFSSLYEGLYAEGIERVRIGLFSISTLLVYADELQPVYRFLHTITGRVRSAEGLATCVIDPAAQDEQTISSVAQTFDGRVDVRQTDDGSHQLRVRGLPDQPDGWQAF